MRTIIKGETYYWALLCDCTEGDPLICGVYPSKKEASKAGEDVKDCPSKHLIKRCRVEIKL